MATESEIKIARYSEVAKEADMLGRVIGVRRLKPSEQARVAGLTPELSGYDELTNASGEKVQVPHRSPFFIAAAVSLIDDAFIPFPRTRGELDAIYDRLDAEGMEAAAKCWVKLSGGELSGINPISPKDESKNS